MRSFMICASHQMLFRRDGSGMWHIQGEKKLIHGFWWGNLKEREHLKELGCSCIKLELIRAAYCMVVIFFTL